MQIIDSTPAALSADLQMYLRNGDVFFDIETTGLKVATEAITEIGAVVLKNGQIIERSQ